MVDSLVGKTCTPCKGGIPPLTADEARSLHAQVANWEIRDEVKRIERTFRFGNFRQALTFVQQVGELAEREGHHPDIRFGWGYATVSLQTKKIKGLHENDFILAAKIDGLFDRMMGVSRRFMRGGEDSDPKEREIRLDQAIEMTFPASDPIAVGPPTGTEPPAQAADTRQRETGFDTDAALQSEQTVWEEGSRGGGPERARRGRSG